MPPAVEDERQQHCIVGGRHVDIVARQNQRIVFNILPDLEDRLLLASKQQGFITDEDYMYATNVRDINVVAREDGTILADKEAIEEDTGYLADLLRERLRQFEMFGRTKAREDLDEN